MLEPLPSQPGALAEFQIKGGNFMVRMTLLFTGVCALICGATPDLSKRGHSHGLLKALLLSYNTSVVGVASASEWTLISSQTVVGPSTYVNSFGTPVEGILIEQAFKSPHVSFGIPSPFNT